MLSPTPKYVQIKCCNKSHVVCGGKYICLISSGWHNWILELREAKITKSSTVPANLVVQRRQHQKSSKLKDIPSMTCCLSVKVGVTPGCHCLRGMLWSAVVMFAAAATLPRATLAICSMPKCEVQ